MRRSSIYTLIVATILGLFFGNALGGPIWAIVVGAVSAAGAWVAARPYDTAEDPEAALIHVQDPPFARFLFQDTRAGAIWLPVRLFLGWEWLDAGWHKLNDPAWMSTGEAIRGFWQRAVTIPEQGRPPITYDWWRAFIQMLLDTNSHVWFAKLITFAELLVGVGLIVGGLVGIAAFGGALMNFSFMLSGTTSTNPVMLLIAFLLVLAWKVAGWLGADRVLLPVLGTPWQKGVLFGGATAMPTQHRPVT
jgi:thiosulfate dehydrogenase [quinone] large subunit